MEEKPIQKEEIKETKKVAKKEVVKEEKKKEKAVTKKESVKKATPKKKEEKLDYSSMTVAELKKIAKEKDIKGYSTMKKDELVKALS